MDSNRKRPLESPSHNEGSKSEKKIKLSDSSRGSSPVTSSARGSPRPLPYWRRNTSSVAGGPFGRRIRNNPPRIIPHSKELTRRSLNSTCSSPSHSNSSENITPPKVLTQPSTPPHHQIYGHAVNPERVEEWLSTNTPETLALDVTPSCSSTHRVTHPVVNNSGCVSKSIVKVCSDANIKQQLNTPKRTPRDSFTVYSGGANTTHHKSQKPSSLSPTSSHADNARGRSLCSPVKKKFYTHSKSLGKEKDSLHTGASSSDTTPPLSPLSVFGKNSGSVSGFSDIGCSSVPVMSSKDESIGSKMSKRRLTYSSSSSKDIESSLLSYTIPKLGTQKSHPSSPLEKLSSPVSHSTDSCDRLPQTRNSDIATKTINSHCKLHATNSATSPQQLSQRSLTSSQKIQSATSLSVGKGSSVPPAKKRKHLIQPLHNGSALQQINYSSESSDCSESYKHHHHRHQKVPKRLRLSSEGESSHPREKHSSSSKHKTAIHSLPSSPLLSLTPKQSKRKKTKVDSLLPLFHPDSHMERKNSSSVVNNDGGGVFTISGPPAKRRHTITSVHNNNNNIINNGCGGKADRPHFSPSKTSDSLSPLKSPTLNSQEGTRSPSFLKKVDTKKSSESDKRRSSAGEVQSNRKRKRSSVSSSDGGLFSPPRLPGLSPQGSPYSKQIDRKAVLKPTKFLFHSSNSSSSPVSQSSSTQHRLNQESPFPRKDKHIDRESSTSKNHLDQRKQSRHGNVLKKHHHHHHREEKGISSGGKDKDASRKNLKSPSHKIRHEQGGASSQQKHSADKIPSSSLASSSHFSESTPHGVHSGALSPKQSQSSEKTGALQFNHISHNSSSHHESKEVSSPFHRSPTLHSTQSTLSGSSSTPMSSNDSKTIKNTATLSTPSNADNHDSCLPDGDHQEIRPPLPKQSESDDSITMTQLNRLSEPVHMEEQTMETPMYEDVSDSEILSPLEQLPTVPPLRYHSKDSSHVAGSSGTRRRYISRATLSSTSSSSSCNTVMALSSDRPPINWKMDGAGLTSDLTTLRAFDKFEQGHLENFADSFNSGGYSLYNYLNVLERLLAHGSFIPSNKLLQVLDIVLRNNNEHFLTRMHTLLLQDLSIRTKIVVDKRKLWEMIESCLEKLQTLPDHLASVVILNYILNVFLKDLNSHSSSSSSSDLNSSLVENILSLQSHYSHVRKVLDLIFSLPQANNHSVCRLGVPPLLDVALTLVCLPLLSCTELDRKDVATKLARDFATRLNGLGPIHTICCILEMIPSNYLREKIVDLYLEREFTLLPQVHVENNTISTSSSLSLTKISKVHLHRTPYHHDGSPHSLNFFLRLLCMLLQSHLHTLQGGPIVTISLSKSSHPQSGNSLAPPNTSQCGNSLAPPNTSQCGSSLVPPNTSQCGSSSALVQTPTPTPSTSCSNSEEIQQGLSRMNRKVSGLANRLLTDEIFCVEMTDPVNWFYFELLTSITS